jgi:hypothetical protein
MAPTIGWDDLRIIHKSLPFLYLGLGTLIVVMWSVPDVDISSESATYLLLPFGLIAASWIGLSANAIVRNSTKSKQPDTPCGAVPKRGC